jgi:hypothetical protein
LSISLDHDQRLDLRRVVGLAAGFFAGAAFAGSGFTVSADFAVELAVTAESRLMIESPARGGASGCLK